MVLARMPDSGEMAAEEAVVTPGQQSAVVAETEGCMEEAAAVAGQQVLQEREGMAGMVARESSW